MSGRSTTRPTGGVSEDIDLTPSRKPQPFRCRDCRKHFSVKTGTVLHGSKLSLRQWAIAFYLCMTSLKGVSSMKLHRDLGITQKAAWHMAHRIREAWNDETEKFVGPVEVDETYIGGLERNKHESKKLRVGGGTIGKNAVLGMKDRETNWVVAEPVDSTDAPTIRSFIRDYTEPTAQVYSDDHRSYSNLGRPHETVKYSIAEYVREQAHTNGIESFWANMKCGYQGVYHKMSPKHLPRYLDEFAGRHNARPMDTAEQMSLMVTAREGKRFRYEDLIGPPETRQPMIL